MPKLDVMKTIRDVKVANGYALTFGFDGQSGSANIICNNSAGIFEMIDNAFRFGYAQGVKATKAAQRRKSCGNV